MLSYKYLRFFFESINYTHFLVVSAIVYLIDYVPSLSARSFQCGGFAGASHISNSTLIHIIRIKLEETGMKSELHIRSITAEMTKEQFIITAYHRED
jgi:hypothetical protein